MKCNILERELTIARYSSILEPLGLMCEYCKRADNEYLPMAK